MEQTFTGNADFGRKVSCLVARTRDLLHKAYLQIDLPPLTANAGRTVSWNLDIWGTSSLMRFPWKSVAPSLNRDYGMWYTIYNELTQVAEKEDAYNVMIGNTAALTTPAAAIPASLYVPLIFWFNY